MTEIRYSNVRLDVIDFDADSQLVTFTCTGSAKKHTIYWDDVAHVATPVGGNEVAPVPFPTKVGPIEVLLSWGYLHRESQDGRLISLDIGKIKYPERLADSSVAYTAVPFRITSLVVSGFELASGEYRSASIDLSDPSLAALAQSITFDEQSHDVELALSDAAVDAFNQGAGA